LILTDTSVWIDHLRRGDSMLSRLLTAGQILGHPAIVGEIGLGSLANRREILDLLNRLPQAVQATHEEVMAYAEAHHLFGLGIGYVDVHLLAATALTSTASLWTRDKRLRAAAASLGSLAVHS
jgi:predicted nucleic acid-binding protein